MILGIVCHSAGRAFLLLLASLFSLSEGGPTTGHEAVQNLVTIKEWLDNHAVGASAALTLPDEGGSRLTHWAASGGHMDVLNYLVKQKADPWDGTATAEERSSLHMACHSGHVDVVKWMLSDDVRAKRSRGELTKSEAVNSKDKLGNTCFILAASSGHAELVRGLAAVDAHVDVTTKKYGSALHVAAAVDDLEMVKELLDLNVDVCTPNTKFETACDRAREEENDRIVKLLAPKEEEKGCPVEHRKGKPEKKKKKGKKGKKGEL